MNCQDECVVLRALEKYMARDYLASKNYRLSNQQQGNAAFFQRQYDYLSNLKNTIMATTNKTFEAQVIELKEQANVRILHFCNRDNGEEGDVPEWCIINFVILPNELIDSEGHVKKDAILQLREVGGGKIYPGCCYERRAIPLKKTGVQTKKMNKESLFEDALTYQSTSTESLWKIFAEKCQSGTFNADTILKSFEVRGKASEEREFLSSLLGVSSLEIGIQENRYREFKKSFLHSAKTSRSDRSNQYQQIFKEIVAFGNSHEAGDVFIDIDNDGTVWGVEKELLDEAPFANRADFQADFRNQLHQSVGNFQFASSVNMTWYKTPDGKLFCRITVPKWNNGVILLNGCELYVREDAEKRQLKNDDFIKYVLAHYSDKAA